MKCRINTWKVTFIGCSFLYLAIKTFDPVGTMDISLSLIHISSKANREHLAGHGLKDGIMRKATKGKPLSDKDKEFNRQISQYRNKIERTFGGIRRWFHGGRCRYRGLAKTHAQNILEAICYSIKRAPQLYLNKILENEEASIRGALVMR